MSTPGRDDTPSVRPHTAALGYRLKHAHLLLEQSTDEALAPLGVTTRDLGILRVIAGGEARSQQEIGVVLGVDRTSMVSIIDGLERAGIVIRRPSDADRRRNVLELTTKGRETFDQAEHASLTVEREFMAPIGGAGSVDLARLLASVLGISVD